MTLARTYRIFTTNGRDVQEHLAGARSPWWSSSMIGSTNAEPAGMNSLYETDRSCSTTSPRRGACVTTPTPWGATPARRRGAELRHERRVDEAFTTAPLVDSIHGLRYNTLHRRLPESLSVTVPSFRTM